jgi:DNA primase
MAYGVVGSGKRNLYLRVRLARIPEEVIERLKEEVSLQRLVELAGVDLRQQGKDLVGLCPFHEERTASLVVSPEKNLWHCMGACQVGGSVIDWVMRAEGVSFRHAVELLRDGVAPSALDGRRAVRSTVAKLTSPLPIGASAARTTLPSSTVRPK